MRGNEPGVFGGLNDSWVGLYGGSNAQKCIFLNCIQSGASSLAKHGGAYFSAVYESIQDPIAAPGPYENQEP